MQWQGKTAFITGGVSGIGFGIARAFSAAGLRLALSYRNEAHKAEAAAWFAEHGAEPPLFIKLDVTDRKRFAEAADETEARFGKVHVLVNNAGVSIFGPTDEASYDDHDWIMGVNYGGVINGLVSFLPKLKSHGEGGHIVNVASMAAFLAGPQAGIYTASKFAVRGLTECLRYDLAPHDIGVSLVCPGLTKTNAWDGALKRPDEFKRSGYRDVARAELEKLGSVYEHGMDPLEVGEKVLRGITENRALILTHPEHGPDFTELHAANMAALPDEPVPEGRLAIEKRRRAGIRAAVAAARRKSKHAT